MVINGLLALEQLNFRPCYGLTLCIAEHRVVSCYLSHHHRLRLEASWFLGPRTLLLLTFSFFVALAARFALSRLVHGRYEFVSIQDSLVTLDDATAHELKLYIRILFASEARLVVQDLINRSLGEIEVTVLVNL